MGSSRHPSDAHRFFFSVLWLPLMALAQKEPLVNIFVGNLAFTVTEQDVRELFAKYGVVDRVNLITDRETERLRGFGFVEMADANAARAAITALNGREMAGRALNVNEAKPREDRSSGGPRGGAPRGGGRRW
jgi:RNA recognition motif-containing protein